MSKRPSSTHSPEARRVRTIVHLPGKAREQMEQLAARNMRSLEGEIRYAVQLYLEEQAA